MANKVVKVAIYKGQYVEDFTEFADLRLTKSLIDAYHFNDERSFDEVKDELINNVMFFDNKSITLEKKDLKVRRVMLTMTFVD